MSHSTHHSESYSESSDDRSISLSSWLMLSTFVVIVCGSCFPQNQLILYFSFSINQPFWSGSSITWFVRLAFLQSEVTKCALFVFLSNTDWQGGSKLGSAPFIFRNGWLEFEEAQFLLNTETHSGKETLHDTVGICYQNISQEINEESQDNSCENIQVPAWRSRRKMSFESNSKDTEPYRKKPKIKSFEYDIKTNTINPQNLIVYQRRDLAWTMSCALLDNVPMWAGWNSKVTVDNLPKMHIGYMETICLPPNDLMW